MIETIDKICQLAIYATASGIMLLAFPFMIMALYDDQPRPTPPKIRALLPARTETQDVEIEVIEPPAPR